MNKTRRILLGSPFFLLGNSSQAAAQVVGAGATFPAPLYFKWADEAKKSIGLEVNYQSVGSGAGINQIRNRTVTFGATDAPLEDQTGFLQFPTVEGSVVPVYNIPGVDNLKLTMQIVISIYRGDITMWNDSSIVALNPGIQIPRIPIIPVYRADGSGTTYIWTSAMKAAGNWDQVGTSIRWPVGNGARGNDGIASTVQRVRGAIGYVEYIYAKNNNILHAQLDVEIRGKTYILLPKNPTDRSAHDSAVKFFEWSFTKGLDIARSMHYHTFSDDAYRQTIIEMKGI